MNAQTVKEERKEQEYLTVGAVITAAGVMFMAGSLQLTQSSLMFGRWVSIILTVLGVFMVGTALGMRSRTGMASKPAGIKAKVSAPKATSSVKRSVRKK
jgi:hypothetical protein